MNELKKTGITKVVIGDPWSPDSGNWIHVRAEQRLPYAGRAQNAVGYVTINHAFKVQSFVEILPHLLDVAATAKAVVRG